MTDKTPALEALKACPFCGGEAKKEMMFRTFDQSEFSHSAEKTATVVDEMFGCRDCGVLRWSPDSWNTRAALQPVSAEPVAWLWKGGTGQVHTTTAARYADDIRGYGVSVQPLYASPPDQSARIRELEAALVEAAVPLEAIRLVGQIPMGMSNEMWAGVMNATNATRKSLNKESDPS